MLLHLGDSHLLRNNILGKYSPDRDFTKNTEIYFDRDVLIICKKDDFYSDIDVNKNSHYLLVLEGNAFLKNRQITTEHILDLYEKYDIDFLLYLNGSYNMFIWDKKKKLAIIANDKIGLNPLYYSNVPNKNLIVSTKIANIWALNSCDKKIDDIALMQYGYSNYVLGKRTFIEGISKMLPGTAIKWCNAGFNEFNYWKISSVLIKTSDSGQNFFRKFTDVFCEILLAWSEGKEKIGVMLSDGYDSRTILASLAKLGIQGYAYTWRDSLRNNDDIVQKLSQTTGFVHRYVPYNVPDEKTDDLIYEVGKLSEYSFPLWHIGRYYAIKNIANEVKILFSGQGELIRITPVPSDYINPFTLAYLHGGIDEVTQDNHFFSFNYINNYQRNLFWEIPSFFTRQFYVKALTEFLVNEAYRSDYGTLKFVESYQIPVALPFLDSRIVELLLKSPFSIARLKTWRRNNWSIFKNRQIYYNMVKYTTPSLLDIKLDRGYPPAWDANFRGFMYTVKWGFTNYINSKKLKKEPNLSPWVKFIYRLLSENRTLNRYFFNKNKILEYLKRQPYLNIKEIFELEKIARFELWYRCFIENDR